MKAVLVLISIFCLVLVGCSASDTPTIQARVVQELPDAPLEAETELAPVEEPEPEPEPVVEEPEKPILTVKICSDTDNGWTRWEQGTVSGFNSKAEKFEFVDNCVDEHYLQEFYCDDDESVGDISFLCRNGCVDGACL